MEQPTELESRNICRICLTQDADFHDIFDSPNLPMEILSIGSVEVFQSDGMPRKVCVVCKTILGNAYKFKQICKRSDTLLKMFPMTGKVPPKIEIPKEMLPVRKEAAEVEIPPKSECKEAAVGDESVKTQEESTQTDPEIHELPMVFEEDLASLPVIAPPPRFSIEQVKILNKSQATSSAPKQFKKPSKAKIESVEIIKPRNLNSQVSSSNKFDDIIESTETAEGEIQMNPYNEEYLDEEYLDGEEDRKCVVEDVVIAREEGNAFSCVACGRSYPLLQQLEIHRNSHTRKKNHPCDRCDKSFFTKYDLAKHVVTHTKQKDHTCIVCKKSFSRSTLLYRHEKIHTDPKIPRHNCPECERVYLSKADLEKHLATHMKNRPFGCQFCEKSFASKRSLERHEADHHTNNHPHPCDYCEMRFPSSARLQRHLSNKHAGLRRFPCPKCPKRYIASHHLYRHMRTAHSFQDGCFQCPECKETLYHRAGFFAHCFAHAVQSLSCPLCKTPFESVDDVSEHIQLHSDSRLFSCDCCNSFYMNQDDLNQHFVEDHSNELCSVGEEIHLVVESQPAKTTLKRPRNEPKTIEYQEIDGEQYEIVNEEEVSAAEIASFEEFEELELEPKAKVTKKKISPKKPLSTIKEE